MTIETITGLKPESKTKVANPSTIQPVIRYLCPSCEAEFSTEFDARDCCEPETVYDCPVCKDRCYDRDDFDHHCDDEHPEQIALDKYGLPLLKQVDLEEAGQQRLL